MSLSKQDLDRLADRCSGATKGPWQAKHFDRGSVVQPVGSTRSILRLIDNTPCLSQGDATFIAAARTEVPQLIEEVCQLREAADEAIGNTAALIELPEITGPIAHRLVETVSQLRGDWVQRGYRIGELEAELARTTRDLDLALAKLVKVGAVVEAAKAWAAWHATALVDGGMFIPEHTLRAAVDALTSTAEDQRSGMFSRPLPDAIENCICSHTVHEGTYRVELNADADCPIHGEHTLLTAMPADEAEAMGEAALTYGELEAERDRLAGELYQAQCRIEDLERPAKLKAKRDAEYRARAAGHNHYCWSCSDGSAPGPGCGSCRQTGMDQTPCVGCPGPQPAASGAGQAGEVG